MTRQIQNALKIFTKYSTHPLKQQYTTTMYNGKLSIKCTEWTVKRPNWYTLQYIYVYGPPTLTHDTHRPDENIFRKSLIDDSITITMLLQFCQQWISQYRPVQKYRVGVMKYLFINLSWLWRLGWQLLTDGPQWSEGEKIDNNDWIF